MPETTPAPPLMETARFRLRPIQQGDAAGAHALYGDPETMRFWDLTPSKDEAQTAERIGWSANANPEWHPMWVVMPKDSERLIGMVNYHARVPQQRRLAVGWILHRSWWRQGVMSEAVKPMLAHCFTSLGTHRVEALIEPENQPSIRLAERLGFRWEGGLMRDRLQVGGAWRSVRMYALLEPEWRAEPAEAR